MDLHSRYPAIADLAHRAQRRLPPFVWEFLDSGTGTESTKARNRAALDRVGFLPSILHGPLEVDLSTSLFGDKLPLPFGVAPVGMSGLVWPDAEGHLARSAATAGIPYTLSTVASQSPEDLAPHLGQQAWFQMYPPKDPDIRKDMLTRATSAGFKVLVLTTDVPVASRRERQVRSGLTQPPRLTPRLFAQAIASPAWALGMARRGMPHMRSLDKYISDNSASLSSTAHIGYLLRTSPDWDYVQWLRDHWQGPMVIKGVMRARDAQRLQQIGVDALWVSNHGGRQFDASPASIEVLPEIRQATTLPLIFDSGVEGGLDMLRALAMGANYIMLGRAFHFALAALGPAGPAHLIDILKQDLQANMGQLGAANLGELPTPMQLSKASPLPQK
ncbi:alpha-hydroxy acid oxidase [Parasedimentitalea psychrophila]|uniref:Alpha-hydroxy acid oxidase n=1 Tax=Parasedimentitalea psychrophila TaxID=2997337 RepID=A0A9Y2L0Q1_9RHOB|nr:alpha-hydroxy acid oxidase [Parasedimentitalea psychrophila]WIY25536.1 alpha-hydroxy acid oxidase [Parasedimentitalea psychrophila]